MSERALLSPVIVVGLHSTIVTNHSTGLYSGIPYVLTLLSSSLSAWYDMSFISSNNYLVAILNGLRVVIELAYVVIFWVYAPKRERIRVSVLLVVIIGLFFTVACISVKAFPTIEMNNRWAFCGFAATGLSIVMYASPLSVMTTVIRTKSVQYMPFLPSLFIFLSATIWSFYDFIVNEKFIYRIMVILHSIINANMETEDKNSNTDIVVQTEYAFEKT